MPPPPPLCPVPASFTQETPLVAGTDYTVGGARAVYSDGVTAYETTVDSNAAGTSLMFPFEIFLPRLSPTGEELFAFGEPNGVPELLRSPHGAGGWGTFETVTVDVAVTLAGFKPGVPTLTNPRRMIVETDTNTFVELSEDDPDHWHTVQSYTTTSLAVVAMSEPALSSDGRNLVFLGKPSSPGAQVQVLVARRGDPFVPQFDTVAMLYKNAGALASPALRPDCSALYVTVDNTVTRVLP
jgi:hypothetical protein